MEETSLHWETGSTLYHNRNQFIELEHFDENSKNKEKPGSFCDQDKEEKDQ